MQLGDDELKAVRERGFVLIEHFLDDDLLLSAQDGLWQEYPRPDEYFADPDKFKWLAESQTAGVVPFPTRSSALNHLALHPDLIDAVERYLGTAHIRLDKAAIWAKYAGAVDYEQPHHRDFMNHSLVVPRADGYAAQLTTILFLSDVSASDGPTAVVPVDRCEDVSLIPAYREPDDLTDREMLVIGPAGSLFVYRTDVVHRATGFTNPSGARFVALADYEARGATWAGKMSWPDRGWVPAMGAVMRDASVRERDLFGWPPPGHPYWNDQTLSDVSARYPGLTLIRIGSQPRSERRADDAS